MFGSRLCPDLLESPLEDREKKMIEVKVKGKGSV